MLDIHNIFLILSFYVDALQGDHSGSIQSGLLDDSYYHCSAQPLGVNLCLLGSALHQVDVAIVPGASAAQCSVEAYAVCQ